MIEPFHVVSIGDALKAVDESVAEGGSDELNFHLWYYNPLARKVFIRAEMNARAISIKPSNSDQITRIRMKVYR